MATAIPPFAVPSKFCQNNSRYVGGFHKLPCLFQTVLSGYGINHKQAFRAVLFRLLCRRLVSFSLIPPSDSIYCAVCPPCQLLKRRRFLPLPISARRTKPPPDQFLVFAESAELRRGFDQISNCSEAAARNVSAAQIRISFPSFLILCASLPMVVVLPTPFTPTTIKT